MRELLEKNGFRMEVCKDHYTISNQYGTLFVAKIENLPFDFEYKALLVKFVNDHTVKEDNYACIKKVVYDKEVGRYLQIQAVPGIIKNQWRIQFYDDEHIFMREIHMNAMDKFDILRWIQSHFCIVKGLCANVLVDPNGGFTNNGISSKYSSLYILDTGKGCCGDEPGDLRECVQIKEEKGRVYARPIIYGQKWDMMGGNFLYSSDYRFWKLAEVDHPVPIYDRCES